MDKQYLLEWTLNESLVGFTKRFYSYSLEKEKLTHRFLDILCKSIV